MRIAYHKGKDRDRPRPSRRPGSLRPSGLIVLATAAVATGVSVATESLFPVVFWTLLIGLFWVDRMLKKHL